MNCPVMRMGLEEAKETIRRLIRGEAAPRVFEQCTLCFNCNNYCPVEGLRPHELIQQRMLESRACSPEYIKYFLNGMPAPVIWHDVYSEMSPAEKAILLKWSEIPAPADELLWIGCVGRMSCRDIEQSKILGQLPKYGPPDLCCGELAYRMGSWQAYADTVERTLQRFADLSIKRLVCYCGSCYYFFSNILPNVYGKKLPFELISLYQWLWEKVAKHELVLEKPLTFTAAVSESCYVSELGPEFWEPLRKLYQAAGASLLELEHHGYDGMTCGTMSMVRKGNFTASFFSMYKEQRKKYQEVKAAGTNQMAVNCPGCFLMPSFTNAFHGIRIRYMLEELLQAYGDSITRPMAENFRLMRKWVAKRMPRLLLHKGTREFPRIPVAEPIYEYGIKSEDMPEVDFRMNCRSKITA